jgi:UDP-N-acetyl-D-galactosamine dehydrogenase
MATHVADQTVKLMLRKGHPVLGSKVLVLGLTFKENCPDLRNSKVFDLISHFQSYGLQPVLVDPWADPAEVHRDHPQLPPLLTDTSALPQGQRFGAVVAAVAHYQFADLDASQWQQLLAPGAVLMDLKGIAPRELGPIRL